MYNNAVHSLRERSKSVGTLLLQFAFLCVSQHLVITDVHFLQTVTLLYKVGDYIASFSHNPVMYHLFGVMLEIDIGTSYIGIA